MKSKSLTNSLEFAWRGIRFTWKTERNFRIQCAAGLGAIGLLAGIQATPLECAVVLMMIGLVLAAELMNTALEHLSNQIQPELHPAIKNAKDCAAGAVLMLAVVSVVVLIAVLRGHF